MKFWLTPLFFYTICLIFFNFIPLYNKADDSAYFKMQQSKPERVKEKSHKYKKDDPTEI